MRWLSPKVLIVLAGVAGLLWWGVPGLVVGLVVGFVLSILLGLVVNVLSGGVLPRAVRRSLVSNILLHRSEEVRRAFPAQDGAALFKALEAEVERVARASVELAPTHEAVFAEGVMRRAVQQLAGAEPDPGRKGLLQAIWQQLEVDWYQVQR